MPTAPGVDRDLSPLTVSLLSATLLLTAATACSSDSESDEEIEGAQTGEGQAPSDDAEPTESEATPSDDGIDRPEIRVADSLELIFEGEPTGDPVKDTILGDSEWQIKAVYEVLTTHDAENSSIGFSTQQPALRTTWAGSRTPWIRG